MEVVLVQGVLEVAQEFLSVQEFLNALVFAVVFNISLEVLSVALFLLRQLTCEDGIRAVPTFLNALIHSLLSSFVVDGVNIFSRLELDHFPEVPVKFLDRRFGLNQVLIIHFRDRLPGRGIQKLLLLNVLQSSGIDLGFHLALHLSLQSVSGIDQDPVMFVAAHQHGDGVLGLLEHRVLEMSVCLGQGKVTGGVVLAEVLVPQLVEVGHVVVHLARELISQSDQLEHLPTNHASL